MASRCLLAAIAAALLVPSLGRGQVVLASFDGAAHGAHPIAGLTLSGGTLYGTTFQGGVPSGFAPNGQGTVFSVPVTGGAPTVLTYFDTTHGVNPYAGLLLSGGTLYGTAPVGPSIAAPNSGGVVFSLPVTGGTPTVLASFTQDGPNGSNLQSSLTLSGGTLYGTARGGGTSLNGTVYSVPVTGGTPTGLFSFGGAYGAYPDAGLTLFGGTLYGTTTSGSAVFSEPVGGGTPTVLASLGFMQGSDLEGGVILSGGLLYGTAFTGGAHGKGTVYSVPVTGGTPTVLAAFDGPHGDGPLAGLLLSGSTLYGTTELGGANNLGVVFSLPVTGGTPTVLASFDGPHGANPQAGLILFNDMLYGTTYGGGDFNDGVVFSVAVPVPEPSTLLLAAGGAGMGIWIRRRRWLPRPRRSACAPTVSQTGLRNGVTDSTFHLVTTIVSGWTRLLSSHARRMEGRPMTRYRATLAALALAFAPAAQAAQVYVSTANDSKVGKYDAATGATINANFVAGLNPIGLALDSSNHLFTANRSAQAVAEYNATTGNVINAAFIATGLNQPQGLFLDIGNDRMFVSNLGNASGFIGVYNASNGATINANLVSGLGLPQALVVDGSNHLFVANNGDNTVSEYDATTGAAVQVPFISGLNGPVGLALDPLNHLLVTEHSGARVGEYNATTGAVVNANFITGVPGPFGMSLDLSTNRLFVAYNNTTVGVYNATTGTPINPTFITGLNLPTFLAVAPVPEPSSLLLLVVAAGTAIAARRARRPNDGRSGSGIA